MLKNHALSDARESSSGVLAPMAYSRTNLYAPRTKEVVALPVKKDGLHPWGWAGEITGLVEHTADCCCEYDPLNVNFSPAC